MTIQGGVRHTGPYSIATGLVSTSFVQYSRLTVYSPSDIGLIFRPQMIEAVYEEGLLMFRSRFW